MRYTNQSISTPDRITRGMLVLFRAMRPRYDDLLLPEVRHTPEGFEFQVYSPRGKAIRTVLLITGMSITGKDDARLLKFARACANAGLRAVIPHLPGLMEFRVEPGDMQRLKSVANILVRENAEKIALIGFSTGGGYSTLLAAQPTLNEKIGPVILFSPIYDVRDVAERLHAPINPAPQTVKDWDGLIWSQFVIAFRNRRQLGIAEAVQEALQILLEDYTEYDLDVKKAFYANYIKPLKLIGRSDLFSEGETLDRLSARGQLANVKSPVFILHDAADRVVPPDHSRRMYSELASRGQGFHQEVLITPWLSHVVMQTTGSLAELTRIISFMGELFRTSRL